MLADFPAAVRLYDILRLGGEDLRPLPLAERRHRLDTWYGNAPRGRLDLSPLVPFENWDDLAALRDNARANGIEGLMLKRRDSPYLSGRPKGPWFKWKRGALTIDAVLMYAQRGHGKRSSFYSDYTFGAWRGEALVPVGKAIPALPMTNCASSTNGCATTPSSTRPGARGRAGPGAGDRVRQRPPLDTAQIRRRAAFPAGASHPLGPAIFRGGYAGQPRAADDLGLGSLRYGQLSQPLGRT
jgi:ATP-dependent DNA ligase